MSKNQETHTVIANNPEFRQTWEDLQKQLGHMLSWMHTELDENTKFLFNFSADSSRELIQKLIEMKPVEGPKPSHG